MVVQQKIRTGVIWTEPRLLPVKYCRPAQTVAGVENSIPMMATLNAARVKERVRSLQIARTAAGMEFQAEKHVHNVIETGS